MCKGVWVSEYLLTGGHVLSMDATVGDVAHGDVHVKDGVIVAVGSALDAPDAERVDTSNCVVLPGFVDTHWHMWNSLWRGLSHDAAAYMGLHRLAPHHTEADHAIAVRFAATEALSAGFTTVHNWSNALRGPADAEAEMSALVESGIRAHFGYGDGPVDSACALTVDDLSRAARWAAAHGRSRLTLGAVIHHGPGLVESVAAARHLGLTTIATHADFSAHIDLLGPDFLYTHGTGDPPQLLALLAARGLRIGLCPSTDLLIGAGLSPIAEMLGAGVRFERMGLSIDVSAQTAVDPFAAVRLLMGANRVGQQDGRSFIDIIATGGGATSLMHPRDALAIGTINGARVLGLDDRTGSLTPGKRADIIVVRTDDLNMLPLHEDADPATLVVTCALPSNVDTVLVDGRVVKRDKTMTGVDIQALMRDVCAARDRILAAATVS